MSFGVVQVIAVMTVLLSIDPLVAAENRPTSVITRVVVGNVNVDMVVSVSVVTVCVA